MPAMQCLTLEFEDDRTLAEAEAHLWDRLSLGGELLRRRTPDGRYRLEVISEKPIQKTTLEKIGGRLVEG
jgi:hypothetical protein